MSLCTAVRVGCSTAAVHVPVYEYEVAEFIGIETSTVAAFKFGNTVRVVQDRGQQHLLWHVAVGVLGNGRSGQSTGIHGDFHPRLQLADIGLHHLAVHRGFGLAGYQQVSTNRKLISYVA